MNPWLVDRMNQSFPDPAQFDEERKFFYAAAMASTFKKVIAELVGFVQQQGDIADNLLKKEKGELTDPFQIGK